ncbi:MAG: tRNA pseudouridine38-40 synthase [Planctomycetota bacterium]|jgi:tRNA pseudouridine38-40 synthase
MRSVRLEVSYDGSQFYGWQRQDGFPTVQSALEDAFLDLTGSAVTVHGSGRTDTGVHALRQVAHTQVDTSIPDDRLRHALNAHLCDGAVVRQLETCSPDFHARFSARGKRYLYVTATTRFRPPMGQNLCHWERASLDLGAMRQAAAAFRGRHDFKAFGNAGTPRPSTVRTVQGMRIIARRERLGFLVQGEGFLFNMVRIMAGTLIEVGRGFRDPGCVTKALGSGVRTDAGATAPAAGLYLVRVLYDELPFQRTGRLLGERHGTPGVFQ